MNKSSLEQTYYFFSRCKNAYAIMEDDSDNNFVTFFNDLDRQICYQTMIVSAGYFYTFIELPIAMRFIKMMKNHGTIIRR